MREDGFAIDRFVFQLISLPAIKFETPPESQAVQAGLFLEQGGRVVIEAEHFSSRKAGPGGHQWVVVPDEKTGIGDWKNAVAGRFLQIQPDGGTARTLEFPFQIPFADEQQNELSAVFRRFGEQEPDNAELLSIRLQLLKDRGDYEALINGYSRLAELDPQKISAWRERGIANWKLGNYDSAIQDMEKWLALQQPELEAGERDHVQYQEAAWPLLDEPPTAEQRHYQKLLEWSRFNIERFPRSAWAWTVLGTAYYRAGQNREAVDALNNTGNLIAGQSWGIYLSGRFAPFGAESTTIQGNRGFWSGFDGNCDPREPDRDRRRGSGSLPNGHSGILIQDASGVEIDETESEARNLISGNLGNGISVTRNAVGNRIRGEFHLRPLRKPRFPH